MGTDNPDTTVETTQTAAALLVFPMIAVILVIVGLLLITVLRVKVGGVELGPSRTLRVAAQLTFLAYLVAAIGSSDATWSRWLLLIPALLLTLSTLPDKVLSKQASTAKEQARKRLAEKGDNTSAK